MKTPPRRYLIYCLALIGVTFLLSATLAYQRFHEAFINVQLANQQKMTRIINQSLKLYFDKLKFVTENAVIGEAFRADTTKFEDAFRFRIYQSRDLRTSLARLGIQKVLENPRKAIDPRASTGVLKNWQVFKALPGADEKGKLVAKRRRLVARDILRTFEDLHYVFEMDMNGDLVFLEPYETQKNVTSFNYEYRDYLQLVKRNRASVISEGYISHDIDRTQIITVASPIFDSTNQVVKIFAASVSAATLREKVFQSLKESMDIQDGTAFYLVDRHGHIVASSSGKNIYFPIEGTKDDEKDQGNLRYTGFFKDLDWSGDTLEKGNVWERGTKSWQFSSLKRDFSGQYRNLSGIDVFGSFFPTAILTSGAQNWGILIETPLDQISSAERTLKGVFAGAGALLLGILCLLYFIIFRNLRQLEGQVDSKEIELSRVAAQVAHDIRSPLAALEVVSQASVRLPEEERLMVRGAVGRIRDIANQLLTKSEKPILMAKKTGNYAAVHRGAPLQTEVSLLSSLVDSLVSEKRIQYRSKICTEIDSKLDAKSYGIFAEIQPVEFKRMLSNLINNSVESVEKSGRVEISVEELSGEALIHIEDNGKGISPEFLARSIGERGATSGKDNGSGLGLYHAKTTVESWGGRLEINSRIGRGTKVTLRLPLAEPPLWFVRNLDLQDHSAVVVLDDDASIHQIWDGKISPALAAAHKIQILHFSDPEELWFWYQKKGKGLKSIIFLVDYELVDSDRTGLDLIEQLGVGAASILVSSRYEEAGIRKRCERLGVRLIPKGSAGFVPVTLSGERKLESKGLRVEALASAELSIQPGRGE